MRVSFNQTTGPNVKDKNGFGYAAKMCKESLTRLGHEVTWRDSTADVEINFIQPQHWHWSGVDYRIGYVPWESTELPDGWVEAMNEVDEVWTPSPLIGQWFEDAGVTKPIKIYEHGVESLWSPRLRSLHGRFWTFHHGGEGIRKGASLARAAHQKVLWEEYAGIALKRTVEGMGAFHSHRMRIIPGILDIDELVRLYHEMNLMVYPSWGEGFGLTPLQAMATGMPVLVTGAWAPYANLLPEYSLVNSKLSDFTMADFPEFEGFVTEEKLHEIHPGKMFKPDFDDLCDKLRYQWENRQQIAQEAFELAPKVHEAYDWDRLTESAFSHLI